MSGKYKTKKKKKHHATHARKRFRSRLGITYGTRQRKEIIRKLRNGDYVTMEKSPSGLNRHNAVIDYRGRRICVVWDEERNTIVTAWEDKDG